MGGTIEGTELWLIIHLLYFITVKDDMWALWVVMIAL